jgi:hypothetical protein
VPNQRKAGTHRRTIAIPDELWMAAKATAARHNTNLSEVVRAALERFVRESEES